METKVIKDDINQREEQQDNVLNVSDDDDDDDVEVSIHHKVPLLLQNMDWDDLTDMLYQPNLELMDEQKCKQAHGAKQILLSLRHKLKRDNLILRASYKGNSFHAFQAKYFHRKASIYMKKMGVYAFIHHLNGRYADIITQSYLAHTVDRVETILDELNLCRCLNYVQHTKMDIQRAQVQLNYLYFVPDTKQKQLLLQPIMVCNNGPTMRICDYLSELLWPILDRITHCQKFSHGTDVIQALETYTQQNRLRQTTLFVTFSMDNLSIVFSHQETLEALEYFLHTYAFFDEEFQRQNVSIETIIQLVRLVLESQYFVYNNKLYRQTAGGASGSPLTMPLTYIYLYYYKPILMKTLMENTEEIFGRHLDEGFLTWNGSKDDLRTLFDLSTIKHHSIYPSIHLKTSIASNVHFMDATLSHHNGILYTKIYHYPNVHYNTFVNIPTMPIGLDEKSVRKVLIRIVCYCSNLKNFNHEQNSFKSTYMSYGLSSAFLEQCIQQFLIEFGASSMLSPIISNPDQYKHFRQRVNNYQQKQIELKKQRKDQEKNTFTFKYRAELDATEIATMKQTLDKIHKEFCKLDSTWNEIEFKLVPYRDTPLSISDYLVEKRPPLRLLTLSESDIDDDSDDDDDNSIDSD